MAEATYLLCAATSVLCAITLARGYRRSRAPLLLWSSLCFAGLALSNLLLVIDLLLVPTVDLSTLRTSIALLSMTVLLFGLVVES
jgi:hypothetical protein